MKANPIPSAPWVRWLHHPEHCLGSLVQPWLHVGCRKLQHRLQGITVVDYGNRGAQLILSKQPAEPLLGSIFSLSIIYSWMNVNKLPMEMSPAEQAVWLEQLFLRWHSGISALLSKRWGTGDYQLPSGVGRRKANPARREGGKHQVCPSPTAENPQRLRCLYGIYAICLYGIYGGECLRKGESKKPSGQW